AGMAFVLGAAGAVGPAVAQAPTPADDNAWVKICNTDQGTNKTLCLITQELRTDSGQFLASVAIRETPGEARKSLLTSVPVGMLLQPGVQLQIDGAKPTQARYSICFPNACYAELAIDAGFVSKLKAGGKLRLTTINQQAKQVQFDLTLIGFTAAYDGEGMNPTQVAARQEELQRELEAKAQEARDRIVAEQRRAIENAAQ
ncbi:MAG: invasion associated locus B family protein, partial [Pseudomonadota bacterium]